MYRRQFVTSIPAVIVAGCAGGGSTTSDVSNGGSTVATPTFSPAGGSYSSAQTVTISCQTSGAAIYYTTDGSTPTTGSTHYTSPVTVSATETLKAIGVEAGMTQSTVGSAAYTISGGTGTPGYDGVIKVSGNHLVNGSGATVQLRGVNMSSLEYAGVQGKTSSTSAWDGVWRNGGASPDWSSYQAWKPNAVRIPLCAASVLGLTTYLTASGTAWGAQNNAGYGNGSADPFANCVTDLDAAIAAAQAIGCYVILDLHWCAPQFTLGGTKQYFTPNGQSSMADYDTAIPFWKYIAGRYGTNVTPQPGITNTAILFELFNEPYLDSQGATYSAGTADQALLKGGTSSLWHTQYGGSGYANLSLTWTIAGHQDMLDAIRNLGAQNICIVNGNAYAQQMQNRANWWPTDTLSVPQLAAGWHTYNGATYAEYLTGHLYPLGGADTGGGTATELTYGTATINAGIPVICTEDGGFCGANCTHSPNTEDHVHTMQVWADSVGASYLTWVWDYYQPNGSTDTLTNPGGDDLMTSWGTGGTGTTVIAMNGCGLQMQNWMVNHAP